MTDGPYRSWVEVDLDNFLHNLKEIKRIVSSRVKIMQVVKADAYGHGAMEIASVALKNGAAALGVANADEGVQLRVSGIDAPIVILSPSLSSEIPEIIKYNLVPSVSDLSFARELDRKYGEVGGVGSIQVEVDTGMGRGGTIHDRALEMIERLCEFKHLRLEGIFTHLASSERLDEYNEVQGRRFMSLLAGLEGAGIKLPVRHMANSGAILNYPGFHLDMVRPGIMSYGIYPSPETTDKADLKPVMTFKTRVILLKEFPSGAGIGYGQSFLTKRPSRIATIPVGYGDGYGFILSNQGEVLIRGRRVPIVGRISMDLSAVDVTDLAHCEIGDEVVLLGRQGEGYISANEIAARVNTISYEILCAIGKRAPRVFLKKGEVNAIEPQLRRIFIPDQERSLARLDSIIRHCLQSRTKSVELGDAIYYEMLESLFGKDDRQLELRTDFRYDIKVSMPSEDGSVGEANKAGFLDVTTLVSYRKILKNQVFMIGCAANNEQLAALFEDKQCQYRWLLNREERFVPEQDFQVTEVRIDGQPIPLLEKRYTERGYEVWCGGELLKEKLGLSVSIEIKIATKKARSSRMFCAYVVYPTRGLEINFDYRGSGLADVQEVSFFSGKRPYPMIEKQEGRYIKVRTKAEDWVFPVSGVAFIWQN